MRAGTRSGGKQAELRDYPQQIKRLSFAKDWQTQWKRRWIPRLSAANCAHSSVSGCASTPIFAASTDMRPEADKFVAHLYQARRPKISASLRTPNKGIERNVIASF
jgi:hypothetical protein